MLDVHGGTVANENAPEDDLSAARARPPFATSAVHVLIGLIAAASANAVVDASMHSIVITAGVIIYVAWFGRRAAGLLFAAGIGAHELLLRPELLSVVSAAGALLLAWGVTTLEEATRPAPALGSDSGIRS